MILQQRLISRSSRSLAVMIGFAQPAGSRGTWRCDGDIDGGGPFPARPSLCASFSPASQPFLQQPTASFHALRVGTPAL
jgi:hypothetical protein